MNVGDTLTRYAGSQTLRRALSGLNHRRSLCTAQDANEQLVRHVDRQKLVGVYPAATFDDLCECFKLVYRNYHESGYCEEVPCGMRYSALQLLPSSLTMITRGKNRIVGTG